MFSCPIMRADHCIDKFKFKFIDNDKFKIHITNFSAWLCVKDRYEENHWTDSGIKKKFFLMVFVLSMCVLKSKLNLVKVITATLFKIRTLLLFPIMFYRYNKIRKE